MNGLVLIDKPGGCTSHDVVNRWRKLAGTKRVGHLGTLDPVATGLLAVVTGTATRLAQFFGCETKTYEAEIVLGSTSDTYDADGAVRSTGVPPPDDTQVIAEALDAFRGSFLQTPPPVSAKKIAGVPAYKLARQQIAVELQPVRVEISRLNLRNITNGHLELTVTCSAGTYIRSLAHDLGRSLGCGGVLSRLRRTQIGDLDVRDARTLDQLLELSETGRLSEAVIPSSRLLPHVPAEHFDSTVEARIRQGRDFRTSPFVISPGAALVKALSRSGDLIAMGELKMPNLYHPKVVL